ncbi:hypothetical protein ABW20_dc0108173 [Dactylellina cionopaga]|nr:hypothetical protein ABW20_dc0108173 [Dactylellina cionopaga]
MRPEIVISLGLLLTRVNALYIPLVSQALTKRNDTAVTEPPKGPRLFEGNGLRAIVPIIKYPARTDVPYKGAILFNPGGPGASGVSQIYSIGAPKEIEALTTGPGWDILGFDPRGIGYSIPFGSCDFKPGDFEQDRQNGTTLDTPARRRSIRQAESHGQQLHARAYNTTTKPDDFVFGMMIPPETDLMRVMQTTGFEEDNARCLEFTGAENQAGKHMNTAVVATDLLSIAKALAREKGEPEDTALLNYYGVSYGTVIGQYFASLYPSNVGRMILHSVVDASDWISKRDDEIPVKHADEAWSQFFQLCDDAGQKCKFYVDGGAIAIRDRFNKITAKLNPARYGSDHPKAESIAGHYLSFKEKIGKSLYSPLYEFPVMADYMVAIEPMIAPNDPSEWNFDQLFSAYDVVTAPPPGVTLSPKSAIADDLIESFIQVSCTDGRDIRDRNITAEDIAAWENSSRLSGFNVLSQTIQCTTWGIRPAWEWYGPIGGIPANPILFIGNRFDPITPPERYLYPIAAN